MQFIIHSLKMVLTFIKSQRNKDQLVDSQGYVYSQTIRKTTWTCAQSKAYKCNVSVVTSGITVNDNITRGPLTRHLCVPKTEYQILFHKTRKDLIQSTKTLKAKEMKTTHATLVDSTLQQIATSSTEDNITIDKPALAKA